MRPFSKASQVASRHVVDMDEIRPRVDEGRDAPARGVEQDATGRCRPDVARSDEHHQADDDGRQALAQDHLLDRALGHRIAALVGADRFLGRQRRRLVDRRRGAGDAERGNAARIDDALDAGRQRFTLELSVPSTLARIISDGSRAQKR